MSRGGSGTDARLGQIVGEVFGHALGESSDQHALPARRALADFLEQVVHLTFVGLITISGSMRPVGRMICSTITPSERTSSCRAGVAETKIVARPAPRTRRIAAAGCRGRTAVGIRSRPAFACASDRLRTCRRSAARSHAIHRSEQEVVRKIVDQAARALAGLAPDRCRE